MFEPYKYEKRSKTPSKGRSASGQRIQNPKLRQYSNLLKMTSAAALIFFGAFLAGTKIINPYLKSWNRSSRDKPIFVPVLGVKTGETTSFSFEELKSASIPNLSKEKLRETPDKFYLTIPKLAIFDAQVKTNDTSLSPDKALGHYYGTSLPGESKSSFVYGHATFVEYYDPKDYKTIFSKLHELSAGDEFTIKYKSNEYKYIVTMKKTLEPLDVNPYKDYYEDKPNTSSVTLMTCTPPGRRDYRLLVIGTLVRDISE